MTWNACYRNVRNEIALAKECALSRGCGDRKIDSRGLSLEIYTKRSIMMVTELTKLLVTN